MIRKDVKPNKLVAKPVKQRGANAIVQARINKEIKNSASDILGAVGLSVSDAVRLLLTRIANEHSVPMELIIPNKKTVEAMKELDAGKGKKFTSVEALMADLLCD